MSSKDFSWLLKSETFEINGKKLKCKEITSKQRQDLRELQEKDDPSAWAAFLVVSGCDDFVDMAPEDLQNIASDNFILTLGTKIAELSGLISGKKQNGELKSDSSTD